MKHDEDVDLIDNLDASRSRVYNILHPDTAPLQYPDATAEHAAQQMATSALETRKRKPRSDKGKERPQKATSAAPVSADNACVHLNLRVSIANARTLACLISEVFPGYAETLQNEIIDQLTARLAKLGVK